MSGFYKQKDPVRIPVPSHKLLEEHFGRISTRQKKFSVTRIKVEPGWKEKPQRADFEEIFIMITGALQIKSGEYDFKLSAGESLYTQKGTSLELANKGDSTAEYWLICMPAFSFEKIYDSEDSN